MEKRGDLVAVMLAAFNFRLPSYLAAADGYPIQVTSFDFQSQITLNLTNFIEKNRNIFNLRQIYYKNLFNYRFNKIMLVL